MPAMRRPLLLLAWTLASCHRQPDAPPAPVVAPRPPIVNRIPAAPLHRIAFLREDGIWTVSADGGDLQRILPPTCPRPADPAWATDRRWLAFTAGAAPDANLYPRNIFVMRPDGADLRQVTPIPRAGIDSDDGPRGAVRGRAVLILDQDRRPLPGFRVSAHGLRKPDATDSEGNFQTYLPAGGGWIKLSGQIEGKPFIAVRFANAQEGKVTDLKDVPVNPGVEDEPAAPAWCDEGRQILYLLRPSPEARAAGAPWATLRRIRLDGSGDESVLTFPEAPVIAGPVVRREQAWVKAGDGKLRRIDLKTKSVVETRDCGIGAPDALAVSPDGDSVVTMTLGADLSRALVLSKKDARIPLAEFKAGEPAPRGFDYSPDGLQLVLDLVQSDGKSSLWILTLATRALTPLVDNGFSPVWHGR